MKSNYKQAYYKEWETLKNRDFERVSKIRSVNYYKEKNQFKIKLIDKEYMLDCNDKTMKSIKDNNIPSVETGVMILNYLSFTDYDVECTNKLVSLKEIPNGGMMFYPAFYKCAIMKLINNFGYDLNKFKICCERLGGKEIKLGDKAYVFEVFPKVRISVAIWEGDEEIRPNATILFDSSVQFLMHVESIIGLGYYLVNELCYV